MIESFLFLIILVLSNIDAASGYDERTASLFVGAQHWYVELSSFVAQSQSQSQSQSGTSQDGTQMEDSRNTTMDTFACVNVMHQMKVYFAKVPGCIPTE